MKTPYLCVRFQTETALILKHQQEESACEGRSEEAVANGLGEITVPGGGSPR